MINAKKMKVVQEDDELEKELMSHFQQLTEEEKNFFEEEIKNLEKSKKELNISEETRTKNKDDLTDEEEDKLYNEYCYNSIIKSLKGGIEKGVCDIEYLYKYAEAKYGVVRH